MCKHSLYINNVLWSSEQWSDHWS